MNNLKEKTKCPHCGREIDPMDLVCPFCGAERKPRMSRFTKKAIIAVLVILVLVLVVWGVLGQEIQTLIWLRQANLEQYEDFDYTYYSLTEEQWEALDQGDYYEDEHWEDHYRDLPEDQQKVLRFLAWDVHWGISEKDAMRNMQRQGISEEDVAAALQQADIDWNKMAHKSACRFLEIGAYSRDGLVSQLESAGFTREQAVYGTDHCGADWDQQARIAILELLETSSNSEMGFFIKLTERRFTEEQAEMALASVDIDWVVQAERQAKNILLDERCSRAQMVDYLEFDGFSHDAAIKGTEFMK